MRGRWKSSSFGLVLLVILGLDSRIQQVSGFPAYGGLDSGFRRNDSFGGVFRKYGGRKFPLFLLRASSKKDRGSLSEDI